MNCQLPGAAHALHVLVVEDDPLVGDTILAMLDGEADAILATDTATACAALETDDRIAVILLDCLLPGGGIARVLSRAEELGIPVVLTSGAVGEIDRLGGSHPSLPKPFTGRDLLTLLRHTAASGR
jgi:CheY-like chemotaxis protein